MDRIHGAHELGWKDNYMIFSNLAPYYQWLYKFRNVFSPTVSVGTNHSYIIIIFLNFILFLNFT